MLSSAVVATFSTGNIYSVMIGRMPTLTLPRLLPRIKHRVKLLELAALLADIPLPSVLGVFPVVAARLLFHFFTESFDRTSCAVCGRFVMKNSRLVSMASLRKDPLLPSKNSA